MGSRHPAVAPLAAGPEEHSHGDGDHQHPCTKEACQHWGHLWEEGEVWLGIVNKAVDAFVMSNPLTMSKRTWPSTLAHLKPFIAVAFQPLNANSISSKTVTARKDISQPTAIHLVKLSFSA